MFDRQATEFGRGPTAFFWEFGRQLAAQAGVGRGDLAVDVAAGTGAVTVPLAAAEARVVSVDLSEPMLRQLPAVAGVAPMRASAQALPLRDASADALTCGFGIAFFPDLSAALREFRRVLKPRGRLALSWWRYTSHTPSVEAFEMGAERSEVARTSWEHARSLADAEKVRGLVREAGFADARVEPLVVDWRPGSLDAFWDRWVKGWTETKPLTPEEAVALRARLERVAARWTDARGQLAYPMEAFAVVT